MSFPYLAEIFIFMVSDLFSAFNMLFASLAAWSTWLLLEKKEHKIFLSILSVAFIAIGFGCYESVIIYFICGIMMALFLNEIYGESRKLKTLINYMIVIISMALGGVLLSKIVLHIFLIHYKITGNNYTGNYFSYNLKENLLVQAWSVIKGLCFAIFRHQTLVDTTLSICIILILLFALSSSIKRKNVNRFILALGIVVSNFTLIIGTGNLSIMENAKRTLVTYGLFTSFSISLFYTIVVEVVSTRKLTLKQQNFVKCVIILAVTILVLKKSREMMGIFWVDHQRALLDEKKAGYINYDIEKTDWRNKPVIFVGYSQDYFVTQEKDPLGSYFNFFKDRTDAERNNYIKYYMAALGYVYPIELKEGMLETALYDSIQQSGYPLDGYVTEYNEYIVVKLGTLE